MTHDSDVQRRLLLATLPPSQRQIRAALGVAVAFLIAFCVTALFANVELEHIEPFIPILAATILITSLITAVLLYSQFCIVRSIALLVLANSYLFMALIIVPYALTFPGSFAPTGLLGAGLQTTAWLYIYWHVAPPLALIVYVLTKNKDGKVDVSQRSPGVAIGLSIAGVSAIVCGLTWVALTENSILPTIVLDGVQLNRSAILLVGGLVMTLNVGALALLWWRRRSVLDLWLMVMCCAWLFVATMAVSVIGSRFTLGWYASRIFELIATVIVLFVLLSETTTLYANLARSVIRQRSSRNARQIAIDAMAASITHEISQPLAAMLTNANAALRWLSRAAPNLNEAQGAIENIVNDGYRLDEIVRGVRSMFKKDAHGRQLLNANDLIKEILTMADLDLRNHGVSVESDLRIDSPRLVADRGQLQQVFLNLVLNAIEAMSSVSDRARVLRISSDLIEASTDVVVTVEDSGIGLEDENKARIFEPFFTTKSSGTGIGLAICQRIIDAHGGSLQASANKPHGTIFRVTLPSGAL
jgi:signal transduction histidine kinase